MTKQKTPLHDEHTDDMAEVEARIDAAARAIGLPSLQPISSDSGKRGRPPSGRTAQYNLRVNPEIKRAFQKRAIDEGITESELFERCWRSYLASTIA
jgi:predicted HicB family RNase H-like nuclease